MLGVRLTSKSTISLPLSGRKSYRAVRIAGVLTVKSMTDWKVSTGGSPSSRPVPDSRWICACSASVRRYDWRAPLTGNELYLNGLNSATTLSHAALANGGSSAGTGPAGVADSEQRVKRRPVVVGLLFLAAARRIAAGEQRLRLG